LLASAYRRSLEVAVENGLKSIAFPSISTGAYGYPLEEAAPIALQTISSFLTQDVSLEWVRFILFDKSILGIYENALDRLIAQQIIQPL
jgi:O-acetyl-ADP-ribose deacetylase (regulator of RNase III)